VQWLLVGHIMASNHKGITVELSGEASTLAQNAWKLTIAAIIVAALYFGQEFFVPLAIAVLLSFALSPVVRAVRKIGVPRGLAVAGTVGLAFAIIFATGAVITTQVTELGNQLPTYETALKQKIRAINAMTGGKGGAIDRASETLRDLKEELDQGETTEGAGPTRLNPPGGPGQPVSPVPVEVHPPPPTALEQIESIISVALSPLATIGIIIVFVVFLLLKQSDVRDRAIRLMGAHDLEKATVAMDDAGSRLSSYFLVLVSMNAGFGAVIAAGLWLIGLPNPLLWGIVAMLLRFVPMIGVFIAAAIPVVLAAAVDPGWTMLIAVIALYLAVEGLMNTVVEPLVQATSTGLSALAVLIAATFWTLLWGPIGLVLAIPLTAVLVVLGRHVDGLGFLHVILGDAPPLTPAEQLYQRLLADDPVEAAEQAEQYLKDRTLTQYYDEVLVPGMERAQADSDAGRLARGRLDDLRAAATILVEAVADLPIRAADKDIAAPSRPSAEWQTEGAVVLISGQSPLDELCTGVLAQQLAQDGFRPQVMTAAEIASAQLQGREFAGVKLVCLVMLNVERRGPYLKLIARRLRRLFPDVKRVGAFWSREKGETRVLELSPDLGLQPLTASLEETMTLCRSLGWQAQT
jgi:predicted PurR-regulated permease PerM